MILTPKAKNGRNDYTKESKEKSKETSAYTPSPTLVRYMAERLQLLKLERELKEKGQELSKDDKERKKLNTRMKVHILDKHIFESMANLIFFFENIAKNDELRRVFDDDIFELLF